MDQIFYQTVSDIVRKEGMLQCILWEFVCLFFYLGCM